MIRRARYCVPFSVGRLDVGRLTARNSVPYELRCAIIMAKVPIHMLPINWNTALLNSDKVHAAIDDLLLTGRAETAVEAENLFLDEYLPEIARLTLELDGPALRRHEAIKLLMSHGSRTWEDGQL